MCEAPILMQLDHAEVGNIWCWNIGTASVNCYAVYEENGTSSKEFLDAVVQKLGLKYVD